MFTRVLGYASLLLIAISVYGTFGLARADRVQGDAARIVYFHVPMAWVAFLAFFVVFAASVAYLRTRAERIQRNLHVVNADCFQIFNQFLRSFRLQ